MGRLGFLIFHLSVVLALACSSDNELAKEKTGLQAIDDWGHDHPTSTYASESEDTRPRTQALGGAEAKGQPKDPAGTRTKSQLIGDPASKKGSPVKAKGRTCDSATLEAEQLWKEAVRCKVDEDCFHYPSTCSAIGRSPKADELVDLEAWRNARCDRPEPEFCGATELLCDHGACKVKKIKTRLDP